MGKEIEICGSDFVDMVLALLGKPLSMGPLSVEHYISVLHR
jgi:hypothetical protein